MGFFCMFCALFRRPNVGQGYDDTTLFLNGNSLCPILLIDLCLSSEDLHGPPLVSMGSWHLLSWSMYSSYGGRFPSVVPSSVLLQMLSRSSVKICGSVVQQSSIGL